jgi:hypothetical protein
VHDEVPKIARFKTTHEASRSKDPKSPASIIASPVNLPSSFGTDVSESYSNRVFNSADPVNRLEAQGSDERRESLSAAMQAMRSWEPVTPNGVDSLYSDGDGDPRSLAIQDCSTSTPRKRENTFRDSKDVQRLFLEERKLSSDLFGRVLELQVGQEHILSPEGFEDDMTCRVVNLAENVFLVYMGLHGPPGDP